MSPVAVPRELPAPKSSSPYWRGLSAWPIARQDVSLIKPQAAVSAQNQTAHAFGRWFRPNVKRYPLADERRVAPTST